MKKVLLCVTLVASARGTVLAQTGAPAPHADSSLASALSTPFATTALQSDGEARWWDRSRADSLAPAGVRFARPVAEGQWLLTYGYERQALDGLRSGRDDVDSSAAFAAGFATVGEKATFQTHRFEVQHGLANGWTVFAGVPWIDREMENRASTGETFTTQADGIGDVLVGGMWDWHAGDGDLVRFNLGLSIPTGEVDARGTDENGGSFLLPYVMQPGTGTHDLLPGVTLLVQEPSWSWGLQAQGRFHVDTNTEGWSHGRRLSASAWVSKGWSRQLSTSLRVAGEFWSDISGHASEADPSRNPLESNQRQGGDRIDAAAGIQWLLGDGSQVSNLLTAEAIFPVDEWLKGPQLSTEWILALGWQVSL